MDKETKKQLLLMEKTLYRIEKDTIELRKKLDAHIEDVWTVYKPIKKIIEKFKLWKKNLKISLVMYLHQVN